MIRTLLSRGAMLLAAAAILAPAARAQARLPETPAGRRAAAFLQTVTSGDTMAVRTFVAEQMDDNFRELPMEQHQQTFARVRGSLGQYQLASVTEQPNGVVVIINGERGPLQLRLEVEPAPPHRIARLGLGRPDGQGQQQAPPPAALTPQVQAQVVDSIAKLFEAFYLLPDSARVIGAKLKERAAAGAYASLTTPAAFAQALTTDIRSVNDDKHLRVLAGAPRPGPGAAAAAASTTPGAYRFFERVEMLPGQVGYLKIPGMSGDPGAIDELGRALRSLEGSRTMVIDLRGNRGGSARLANTLISHFTEPGLVSLHVWAREEPNDTVQRRTLADVPGPRRTDVPLFVLVDSATVSAGEDVAFVLRNL
ncbi:MAG TPA: S41 family peptidase, partial [Longimicrobium sp.]|nr:S41 family peptidase [Longimicrobium sp.]